MPDEHISFGIGCFYFQWTPEVPFRMEVETYVAAVRKHVEQLSSVSAVQVDYDEHEEGYDVTSIEYPSLSAGEGAFPSPVIFELSYDLYIPYRVQKSLSEPGIRDRTTTEQFRIHQHITHFEPVTFVQLVDPDPAGRPSSGVRVVREYVKTKLPRDEDDIEFDYLGPSPFHANFSLSPYDPEEADAPEFVSSITHTRGYADIEIEYNRHVYSRVDWAFYKLRMLLMDEAGLFYRVKAARAEALAAWDGIQASMYELIETVKGERRLARWGRLFLGGEDLQDLRMSLVEFSSNEVLRRGWIDRNLGNVYDANEPDVSGA